MAPSPLATGNTITVQPCNININTSGQVAKWSGPVTQRALVLGTAASSGASLTVSVNAGGQITLSGQTVGTVTLATVTGS